MKLMMITKTKKKKALERKKHSRNICDFITTVLIVVTYRATWDTFQPQLNK